MTKEDYVYNGAFNRALFEKYTINIAVKDINNKSKFIRNLRYEKKVIGFKEMYSFMFTLTQTNLDHNMNILM